MRVWKKSVRANQLHKLKWKKKSLKMKIYESGAVIQFNPVGATLYKKKKNKFCLKE